MLGIQDIVRPSAPVSSKTSGTYSDGISVVLTSSGSTSIMYTTNGTSPSCSVGSVYSSAISITSSTVLKAVGCVDGIASSVSTFTYVISSDEDVDFTPTWSSLVSDEETDEPTSIVETLEQEQEESGDTNNEENSEDTSTTTEEKKNFPWWIILIIVSVLCSGWVYVRRRERRRI